MAETAPWGSLPSYEADPPPPTPPSVNGWGIAGFVIGIVSFCVLAGVLAPIGLLLSVVGLFKPPRGWAIAGFATNLLGLCCCLPVSLPFILVFAGVVSTSAMTLWLSNNLRGIIGPDGVTGFHIAAIIFAANMYFAEHQAIAPTLADLKLDPAVLKDGWGNPFQYEVTKDPEGFIFWSPGADGADGTGDDIRLRGIVTGGGIQIDAMPRKRGGDQKSPSDASSDAAPAPPGADGSHGDAPQEAAPSTPPASTPPAPPAPASP